MKTIGSFLKEKRIKANLWSYQIPGINYSAVSRIERNLVYPRWETLQKYAKAFDTRLWKLMKEFEAS